MTSQARVAVAALLTVLASPAYCHIMQVAYTLPVPLWMYAYGATGALIASFVVVGYFVKAPAGETPLRTFAVADGALARAIASPSLLTLLRTLSVLALAAMITTGFAGSAVATANLNVTFFWVVFVLAFFYLTALIGDLYAHINPWRVVCEGLERWKPGFGRGRHPYPVRLGYYPALVLYMAFIWLELFGRTAPRSLSLVLATYTLINLAGAWTFGIAAWFRYGEFFGVMFRLVGKLAPLEWLPREPDRNGLQFRWRYPFAGLLQERPEHFSLVLFVLFMLSSTAFDGVHETVPWVSIFWRHIYPVIEAAVGAHGAGSYLKLVNTYYYWQWLMLIASPFIYLAIYYFFVALAKRVTRTAAPVSELALVFAYALIPIAFVYHVTHYFTLLLAQGPSFVSLLSDPLGRGWNLLGTKNLFADGVLLEAGLIWHTQVWLILIGHIVSVYLSHVEALRIFRSPRQALLSQAPLLVLMVALTTIGLWILSMPIAAGQVMQPPTTPG